MSDTETYKRFPAIRCWIHHIMEGKYSHQDKSLYTIFGQVKRVRLMATIIEKRELLSNTENSGEDLFDEEESSNMRIEFDLDDGTGRIRATLWRVNPEDFEKFREGDIVDVIGLIRRWKEFTSISPEIIKKIQKSDALLLRDAEIINRMKAGETTEIPEVEETDVQMEEMTDEIDIDTLFSDEESELTSLKEEIFSIIKDHSIKKDGIKFSDLKKQVEISEEELKNYLRELEMEMKVYQSDEEIYQIYS